MAEHAGATSAARAAATHQPMAPAGCAWFLGPSDRKTHSQAIRVPSKAQVKLLAEYHQTASMWTAERLKTPTAARAAVAEPDSRRTRLARAARQSKNGTSAAAVNAAAHG